VCFCFHFKAGGTRPHARASVVNVTNCRMPLGQNCRRAHVSCCMDKGTGIILRYCRSMNKFWKVTIYSVYREFGGHEEGGWYYTAGSKVNAFPKKFKTRMDAAAFVKKIHSKITRTEQRHDCALLPKIWFNGSGPKELPRKEYC
jgi:hypothetical protein